MLIKVTKRIGCKLHQIQYGRLQNEWLQTCNELQSVPSQSVVDPNRTYCPRKVEVKEYFNVKEYVRNGCKTDDYAIVELAQPINDVAPVCLPIDKQKPNKRESIHVAGYSKNLEDNYLLRTTIVKRINCPKNETKEEFMCTKQTSGAALCDGDSGAHFMRKLDGRYVLMGVTKSITPNKNCRDGYAKATKLKNKVEQIKKYMQTNHRNKNFF